MYKFLDEVFPKDHGRAVVITPEDWSDVKWFNLIKEVCDRINKCISEQRGDHIENIKPSSHLKDDLQMDSLDDAELVMMLEEEFYIEISDEEAERCGLVKDIYIGILGKLGVNISEDYFKEFENLHKTPNATTKEALMEVKDCTFTPSDIFQQMLKVAQDNRLFIQFDGFTENSKDTIVVTHAYSDTEYVVTNKQEFDKLVESLKMLEKFERS